MTTASRRTFLKMAGAGCAGALLPSCATRLFGPGSGASAARAARKPNVIVILSDDQGYGDLSCHGNPVLRTPNFDRLHAESIRLTDFHVAPMCSPTRGQLMTGMDALHNAATATCMGRHIPREGIPTVAEMFRDGGYRTGIFGKWHLGNSHPFRPMDRGFEEAVYFNGFGLVSADDYWCNDYFDPWYLHGTERIRGKGYCDDLWFDMAMRWMRQRRADGEPFFCYIPTNVPHFPFWVADEYRAIYKDSGADAFFGMIANLDRNIGRLDAFMRETGLRDNTILVFMSDNGATGGLKIYNADMKGGKCSYYDGGHRVPCFIRWPEGRLGAPRDVATPTQVQDIMPTLAGLCRLETPSTARLDGADLTGLLRGGTLADRKLVVQYCQFDTVKDRAAVIWNNWRLVFGKELYDINKDPGQTDDVSARHPDIVEAMRAHYDAWWAGAAPAINDLVPVHIGSDAEPETVLTCCEWQDVRSDGAESVRDPVGGRNYSPTGAQWNVFAEQGGTYTIELRRWPRESGLALDAAAPEFRGVAGSIKAGAALPIASACLRIGARTHTAQAAPGADSVAFTVPIPAGKRTMHGWFRDAHGRNLCGALFAHVRRA